jgi:hypothetical protein
MLKEKSYLAIATSTNLPKKLRESEFSFQHLQNLERMCDEFSNRSEYDLNWKD